MQDNASFRVINIDDILPNRFQPRIKFEDESLEELAESINKFGVIEPIVVRPVGNKFEIIAGERRYKASKLASKTTIPSIIIDLSDKDSEELALLENVQRQSLNPIEEAVSYKRILDMGYISREELSKKIGKPQSVILNKTRLLNLADEVQSYLLNNKISERHARALLKISNLDDQVDMLHRIVNERLTVKKTNREIRNYIDKKNDDEDVTETLFDERGNDMDIDKMMNEAKDINNSNDNSLGTPPNLMDNENVNSLNTTSEGTMENSSDNIQNSIQSDNNRFVNVGSALPLENNVSPANQGMVNNSNTGVNFDNMFNNSINNASSSVESADSVPAVSSEPLVNDSSVINQPVSEAVSSSTDNSINNEISSIVSDALNNQSNLQQVAPLDNQINNISNIQPNLNQNVSLNNNGSQPIVQNDNLYSQENVQPVSSIPSSEIINDFTSPGLNTSNPLNNLGDAVTNVLPAENKISDFGNIVQKLRDCADEIEKLGHYVNLEEVDLGNQYKVIFTFDK